MSVPHLAPLPPLQVGPSNGPASVLLVDDDPAILETLKMILDDMGFRTETASTGSDALARVTRRPHNLALLDIGLPGMQGTELLTHARGLWPDMKCIMVTGNTDLQLAVDALNKGAYAYIRKPFEVPDVVAIITRALNEQGLELASRAFAELSQKLVENLELDARLELICSALARVTGLSRCGVWLMNRDSLGLVFLNGADETQLRRLKRRELALDEVTPELRRVLDTAVATAVADPRSVGLLPEPLLEEWQIRTMLLLPLHSGGRIIGLVALSEPGEERPLPAASVDRARTIAHMAAVAIQQARTVQEERDTLQTLAQSFLATPPDRPDIRLASRYQPAAEVAKIGGDYFDFIEFDERRLGVVIGDVCGKGLQAAIYTGKAKDMLRAYALENYENAAAAGTEPSTRWAITRLNRALCNQMSDMFVTMVYGILDTAASTFTYTNAGHPHPVLIHGESREAEELRPSQGSDAPTDGLVGAVEEMEFTERVVPLQPGSALAFFTDGVTEARTGMEMLNVEGVLEVVVAHSRESAEEIANAIFERAVEFASGVLRDDVAIVVLKNDPPAQG